MTADPAGGSRLGRRLKVNGQAVTVCRAHLGEALEPRAPDILEALAALVVPDDNGCWAIREDARNRYGYGELKAPGVSTKLYAHHITYALFMGGWGQGEQIHHRCRHRACVHPQHLRAIKARDHEREKAKPAEYGRPRSFESNAAALFAVRHGFPWTSPPTPALKSPPRFSTNDEPPLEALQVITWKAPTPTETRVKPRTTAYTWPPAQAA